MPSDELEHQGAAGADVDVEQGTAEYRPPRSFGPDERDCNCPRVGNEIYHDRRTCTDPVARRLEWFGTPPPFDAEDGPRPATPGATL